MHRLLAVLAACLLAACAAPAPGVREPVPALLLGEQHDAAEHHVLQRQVVEELADRQLLAAVVLEMAQRGRATAGLPPSASDAQVREALGWSEEAWPWASYGPAVMAAVRAGVPVMGTNLDMPQMREAMGDARLDALLPPQALRGQQQAIRAGHCDMIPEGHIGAMARVQIARDRAMADAVARAAVPGKTVVLLAGAGHVDPALGVPLHLGTRLRSEAVVLPPIATGKDYCADLRRQMPRPAS